MNTQFDFRIINSARWAAYGDALGFISELTDSKGLLRRLRHGGNLSGDEGPIPWADLPIDAWPLQRTVDWKRRVGGRQGALATLPAGTYSDDTQLRLATCRAMEPKQGFDLEVFTKVELPVWLSYSLGAGRASKRAAANLARGGQWLANSYSGWTEAGGNGVVIRVQPHAWEGARSGRSPYDIMLEVLKNGLSTHGHPRALASACVHADLLLQVLRRERNSVSLRDIHYAVEHASRVPELLEKDPELSRYTIPAWEEAASEAFSDSWHRVIKEMAQRVDQLAELFEASDGLEDEQKVDRYLTLLRSWGLFEDEQRGSGTGTLFAALALLFLFPGEPSKGIRVACGVINSDTDSIATVYGGIAGALLSTATELPGPIQDDRYIVQEALRVAGAGGSPRFHYPDLLYWQPPQTQADVALVARGRKFVAGLGYVKSEGEIFEAVGGFNWQWLLLEFGQNVLVKQRQNPKQLSPDLAAALLPAKDVDTMASRVARLESGEVRGDEGIAERLRKASESRPLAYRQDPLIDVSGATRVERPRRQEEPIESAVQEARASGMNPEIIGRLLLELSREVSIEAAVAFAGIISREGRYGRPRRSSR
ncbi:ADP-ribosylglycohydrolase family protein [Streptomyces sp. I4(2020)]|uniref:ADP-ribosylglycohydrolase family protein n=1 Tax=Streptomyces sp. I4(2020) TaxID=2760981 RepID=UPI0018EEA0C2|nr:ADP-ribosylglycohydrolase family protein [Streptomyces sp. I4(2020)]MBJ6616370.1 ADP-ribosylglycohydrolase family protein [Streptomyces sp. I3(2020)]MBJ6627041.1 ADP-ribosylglycohydrolase family protein [Streptomyces sp. I4(2020)]